MRHEWEGMTAVSCLDGCLGCHGAYADPCDAGAGLRYMLTMRSGLFVEVPCVLCLQPLHYASLGPRMWAVC